MALLHFIFTFGNQVDEESLHLDELPVMTTEK
jgi:hypothetical protein